MNKTSSQRIISLDILKGLVMIIMTLDHVRDYFHYDAFFYDPTDLSQTSPALFLTRFITHFCAPVFVLLAGTSAYLVGRRMSKKELSVWLLKRGLWLIFLEITVIRFAWVFSTNLTPIWLGVIWAIGAGMISLALFIRLPKFFSLSVAMLMIFGHNALDGFYPEGNEFLASVWKLSHVRSQILLGNLEIKVIYPVIPWLGLIIVGYYFGSLYQPEYNRKKRLRILLYSGISCLLLFTALRFDNLYGDPSPWTIQSSPVFSFLSFINVTKYPPSLLYLLITIGPSLIFLYLFERLDFSWLKPVVTIGRVPMFWYIVHLFVIHFVAMIAAMLTGYKFSDMILTDFVTLEPQLKGYGFPLWAVYLFWIGICLFLYPVSRWYDNYKRANRDKWWLSYL
ncbi:DUF1624 domain-containing protein [Lutimonas vermicola]|uniref:Heparan-alpha-glucosaminide N-acetyltransferase domain-containing protein n=1 Tax=Lutimonas vermicola TaxID=414288 RepID=A0ABU9L1X0_9FLAO